MPAEDTLLKLTLKGIEKKAPRTKKKTPLKVEHLLQVRAVIERMHEVKTFLMMVIAFFGLLRISEVV
jgi:hypothetical protein